MLAFFAGILIIGALLAAVFGKGIGQLFVLGSTGIVFLIIGVIALFVIVGLIQMQFMPPRPAVTTSRYDDTYSYMKTTPADPAAPVATPAPAAPVATPAPAVTNAPIATTAPSYTPPAPSQPAAPSYTAPSQPAPERKPFDNIYNPFTGGTAGDGPSIGITQNVPAAVDEQRMGVPPGYGILVEDVRPGSPADIAGLRTKDFITTVDGRYVSSGQLRAYEATKAAGQSITLLVYRIANGRMLRGEITVTPM